MKAKLIEKPNGYTSKYYAVTVGKTYTVLDIRGSCFFIKDDNGEDATIAAGRFEVGGKECAQTISSAPQPTQQAAATSGLSALTDNCVA